jgi:septal ring factor EnvC (AmiA/AmiB activator)
MDLERGPNRSVHSKLLIPSFLALWLMLGWVVCPADDSLTRKEAETRLEKLKTEIEDLKKTLERTQFTLSDEQKALRASDLEIQLSVLEMRKLDSARQAHEHELSTLNTERQNYLGSLDHRREILAKQIMAAFYQEHSHITTTSAAPSLHTLTN